MAIGDAQLRHLGARVSRATMASTWPADPRANIAGVNRNVAERIEGRKIGIAAEGETLRNSSILSTSAGATRREATHRRSSSNV
jgi:hypothetical protein